MMYRGRTTSTKTSQDRRMGLETVFANLKGNREMMNEPTSDSAVVVRRCALAVTRYENEIPSQRVHCNAH